MKSIQPGRIQALNELLNIEDSLDFLDALSTFGSRFRSSTASEFVALPELRRKLILVRALYLKMNTGDFSDFLSEEICGAFVHDLKSICHEINAKNAVELIETVEAASGNRIPSDSSERFLLVEEIGATYGGHWFRRQALSYKATGEDLVELLRKYVRTHKEDIEKL